MSLLSISLISGFLTGLSFIHPNFSFLVWFSFSPLFYILENKKNHKRYFFIAGFIYFLTVIFWVGFVTRLGAFVLISYLALYWFAFALFAKVLLIKPYKFLSLPALWIILEYIRENFFWNFGWAIFGYSQYKNLWLIQISDLLGVKFISFLILTVNYLIFLSFKEKRFLFKKTICVACILLFCFGYSTYRLKANIVTKNISVNIAQPNIPQKLKWDPLARDFVVDRLKKLGKESSSDNLTIYPESAWPLLLDIGQIYEAQNLAQEIDRDILMGAVIRDGFSFYNSAFLVKKDGELGNIYHKIKLVPFGEYVPLRSFLTFIDVFNAMGDISPGKEKTLFQYNESAFSVLVCFEDAFPQLVSDLSRGRDFLINMTNDAWFMGNPQSRQHLSIMTFRAIENRISIVRAANTGVSGYVDFLGNIETLKINDQELFTVGVKSFNIPLNLDRSIYNKIGEAFVFLCALFILFSLFVKENMMDKKYDG